MFCVLRGLDGAVGLRRPRREEDEERATDNCARCEQSRIKKERQATAVCASLAADGESRVIDDGTQGEATSSRGTSRIP